jgi:homoserine O-acetyltransferase
MKTCHVGDFLLESGEVLPDLKISYQTSGVLNSDRSNAILSLHGLGGNRSSQSNWAGAGQAFDSDHYFVIQPDTLGTASTDPGATTSPTRSGLNMRFPRFTVRDMVNAEHQMLTRCLGIEHLVAVTGTSMGGMEALQWAVSFPEYMDGVIAMLPLARANRQLNFVLETARQAIMLDSKWRDGDYPVEDPPNDGLGVGLQVQHAFTTSAAWYQRYYKDDKEVATAFEKERMVLAGRLQARDWIYRSWAVESHDIGNTGGFQGNLAAAAKSIKARVLVLSNSMDQLLPLAEGGIDELAANTPHLKIVDLRCAAGHRATVEPTPETRALVHCEVAELLKRITNNEEGLSGPRLPPVWSRDSRDCG